MEIYKAQITFFRSPTRTSVHDRYFARKEDAIQTFRNILAGESGVSIESVTEEVYDKRIATKNGAKVAELRVLKLPLYEAPRPDLSF